MAGGRAATRQGRGRTDRRAGLRSLERLESRALMAGMPGPDAGLAAAVWHGHHVVVHVDHYVGRLAGSAGTTARGWARAETAFEAAVAHSRPGWGATSLGDGFFSLTTPGADRTAVLRWAAHTRGVAALEPELAFRTAALPNDPSFPAQWSLQNTGQYQGTIGADINAPRAWSLTTGSRSVVVAVIDSGIDITHPDLAANIWTNPGELPGNAVDDDRNGYVDDLHGWNFVDNNADVGDGYGHGTHVAGIIGAVGNNGVGVTGVAWQVSLMALKVEDSRGVGYTSSVIAALNYVTTMRRDHGINIVVANASWESAAGFSTVVRDAIQAEGDAGVTFVAAAGNDASDNDLVPRYPSGYRLPNVITVAALDDANTLAGMSNYGATTVDLAAPGTMITSTLPGGAYGMMSGTSMAAPEVSGVVALLAAAKPGITVAEVRAAILGSTAPVADLAGKTVTGGRLDAFAALGRALAGGQPAPAPVPAPTPAPLPAPVPAPVSPPTLPAPVVSLPYASGFQQPDGVPNPDWVQRIGGFTVVANTAAPNPRSIALMTLAGTSATDVHLRAVVDVVRGGAGLVARYADGVTPVGSAMLTAQLVHTGPRRYAVQVWRHFHGTWRLLATRRTASGSGELAFDVVGNRLTISFQGRQLAVVRERAVVAPGAVGLRAWGAAKVRSFNAD